MIDSYEGKLPHIHGSCFIAKSAEVIGNVKIEENSSIWYGAVLRGDDNTIQIGKGSNIQDQCTLHISHDAPVKIGNYVTVGHNAIIHGCMIDNYSLIGMGSIILDGAKIGAYSLIGAGSVVTPNTEIPSGVLALGSPARVIRELSEEEKKSLEDSAVYYIDLAKKHRKIKK